MGSLKPGATYVYEYQNGRIFAREFGQTDRQLVGYDSKIEEYKYRRFYMNEINAILTMCESHPDMQDLWEKLLIMYNLRKTQ